MLKHKGRGKVHASHLPRTIFGGNTGAHTFTCKNVSSLQKVWYLNFYASTDDGKIVERAHLSWVDKRTTDIMQGNITHYSTACSLCPDNVRICHHMENQWNPSWVFASPLFLLFIALLFFCSWKREVHPGLAGRSCRRGWETNGGGGPLYTVNSLPQGECEGEGQQAREAASALKGAGANHDSVTGWPCPHSGWEQSLVKWHSVKWRH